MKDKISILVKKTALEFDKMSIPLFAPFDLTPSQYKVLRLLYLEEPDTVRQIDIEHYFSMTNPTVTGILNNLEKNSWTLRIPNPKDTRSKVIRLTEKAVLNRETLLNISDELENVLTARLNKREKEQLTKLLNKMLGEDLES